YAVRQLPVDDVPRLPARCRSPSGRKRQFTAMAPEERDLIRHAPVIDVRIRTLEPVAVRIHSEMLLHVLVDQLLKVAPGGPQRPDHDVRACSPVLRHVPAGILEDPVTRVVEHPTLHLGPGTGNDLL